MKTTKLLDPISRKNFLRSLVMAAPFLPATALLAQTSPSREPADPVLDPGNLRAFVELARADIRTQKALVIAQNIDFTADEAVEFWPMQREYDHESNKWLDERYAGVLQFTREYGTMTDAQATSLARRAFDIEEKRTSLKRKYFKKFSKVISAVKAARFFQIENQINLALDLRLAASLPLIK